MEPESVYTTTSLLFSYSLFYSSFDSSGSKKSFLTLLHSLLSLSQDAEETLHFEFPTNQVRIALYGRFG